MPKQQIREQNECEKKAKRNFSFKFAEGALSRSLHRAACVAKAATGNAIAIS